MRTFRLQLSTLVIAAAMILPAWAHHSHGNYDLNEYTHLEGTVAELIWINPHTWIYLEVADEDGEVTLWALEGGSTNALSARGWTRDSVKVGDHITVRCHQLRDGFEGCLLGYVTPPGGVENEFD